MKKLLIITSAILLLAAACNKQAAVQPASNQQANNSTDQTANWKTYSDTQHGFEFRYLEDSSNKDKASFVASDGRMSGLIFSVEKDGVESLFTNFEHKAVASSTDCSKNSTKLGAIIIANISTNKCSNDLGWNAVISNKVANGFDIYTFSCSNEHTDFEAYCEKILSTFKFTDSSSTGNWKTYTNSQYGYSVQYTSDVTPVVATNPGGEVNLTIENQVSFNDVQVGIWIFAVTIYDNPKNQTFTQILPDLIKLGHKQSDVIISDTTVDGYPAKKIVINNFGDSHNARIIVERNGKVYELSGFFGTGQGNIDTYAASFKFTK